MDKFKSYHWRLKYGYSKQNSQFFLAQSQLEQVWTQKIHLHFFHLLKCKARIILYQQQVVLGV